MPPLLSTSKVVDVPKFEVGKFLLIVASAAEVNVNGTNGRFVAVGVIVGVLVIVGVKVGVRVGVSLGVGVSVGIVVAVGVSVIVAVGVKVGVSVGAGIRVWVEVAVIVGVGTGFDNPIHCVSKTTSSNSTSYVLAV